MSGRPPVPKHIPRSRPGTSGKEARAAELRGPAGWSHYACHTVQGVGDRGTHPLWQKGTKRHGGPSLSRSGLTSWTLHSLMYKYLPLAKVQAALCGCQTQQKTNIQGKVFTAVVAKGATASKRSHPIGQACLWCYHKAPGHWPLATGGFPPFQWWLSSLLHTLATVNPRPIDMLMVLHVFLQREGPEWAKPPVYLLPLLQNKCLPLGATSGGPLPFPHCPALPNHGHFSGPVAPAHIPVLTPSYPITKSLNHHRLMNLSIFEIPARKSLRRQITSDSRNRIF